MTTKGIIFSAPMVRALLDGRKTQTRRLLRNPEYYGCPTGDCPHNYQSECRAAMAALTARQAGYAPGDRLYVRESYTEGTSAYPVLKFAADGKDVGLKYTPSIYMPRRVSRLWLAVTDVRVQRVQEISQNDAYAEGVERQWLGDDVPFPDGILSDGSYKVGFFNIWDSLHPNPGTTWTDDPWIVAITFTVYHGNVDQ